MHSDRLPKHSGFWDGVLPPIAIAHRGGGSDYGQNRFKKENTLKAFQRTVELGYLFLELDVIATSDNQVVVLHVAKNSFEALQRKKTAPSYKALQEMSYEELRSILNRDIPTLKQVLDSLPSTRFFIDAKSDRVVAPLSEVIRQCKAEKRVCLGSLFPKRVSELYCLLGQSVSYKFIISRNPIHTWKQYRHIRRLPASMNKDGLFCDFPKIYFNRFTARYLNRKRVRPMVWTINDRSGMEKALRLGAFGIISDDPVLLKQTIQKHFPENSTLK